MLLLSINMFFHNNHRSSQDMTRWWVTPGEDPKRCNPVCYIHIHQRITLIDLVCILRAHPDIHAPPHFANTGLQAATD